MICNVGLVCRCLLDFVRLVSFDFFGVVLLMVVVFVGIGCTFFLLLCL